LKSRIKISKGNAYSAAKNAGIKLKYQAPELAMKWISSMKITWNRCFTVAVVGVGDAVGHVVEIHRHRETQKQRVAAAAASAGSVHCR